MSGRTDTGYQKLIDMMSGSGAAPDLDERSFRLGDRTQELVYVYDDNIDLALNVALAAGRPLLVKGETGTGKSSLAMHLAARLGWPLYSQTIGSRTQARDLQWTHDTVARLADAEAGQLRPRDCYVSPGVIWWAFNPEAAQAQVDRQRQPAEPPASNLAVDRRRTILLIDEIDKADPDVPNDLLQVLGSYQFRVDDLDIVVEANRLPLVIITTNEERDLPRAFLRRCVTVRLEFPDEDRLVAIANAHFPNGSPAVHKDTAQRFRALRHEKLKQKQAAPGTAEYLDTLRACYQLQIIDPKALDDIWKQLARLTLDKGH